MKRMALLLPFVFAALAAGCSAEKNPFGSAHAAPAPAAVAPAAATQTLPDFAAIAEANKNAVVNITVSSTKPAAQDGEQDNPFEGTPFEDFFKRYNEQQAPNSPRQGLGSGFIVDSSGLILTNAHVVDGADEVRVRLTDRREFKGKVLGVDKPTDIAVVKIDATGLPAVKLGDPRAIRVGEWVLAIGSPFGFDNTVTAGIVSATSRSLPEGTYVPFIQTDAAVNPGNSGGPLFNLKGEVVGINSQIYSRSGGYQGIAFAIPIDVAVSVKEQLVKSGKVERGRLGVAIQEVTAPLARSFGLDKPAGALVASVEKGSPAEKAGLKQGDVILGINGKPVERSAEVPPLVAAVKPGTDTKVQVWRDGKKNDVTVRVGALNPEKVASAGANADAAPTGKLGLALRPSKEGLVVERAAADGPAARAGIRAGDVLTAVNGKPAKTPEDLLRALDGAHGSIAVLVRRGEQSLFVPIELG
jgi:serine protease Do